MKKERISVLISDILSKKEHPDITREAYPYNVDFRVLEINLIIFCKHIFWRENYYEY